MSDYFEKFESELHAAAERLSSSDARRRAPYRGWRPRGLLLVGLVLVIAAVPALAAVTGAFDSPRAPEHLAPGSGKSLAPPCKGPTSVRTKPVHGPAPASLTRVLAVLRRPPRPADRIRPGRTPPGGSVLVDAIRLAYVDRGVRYYVVPMGNLLAGADVPNTPACAFLRRELRHHREVGACVWRVGRGPTGGGCATSSALKKGAAGPQEGFSSEMPPGTMYVSGIAADGVKAVILRYPPGAPVRMVRIPVRGNVYATIIRGRPELTPAVYAQGRNGVRLVEPGRQRPSKRQRALNQRSSVRDLTATGRPTVVPPVGYPHTTFTFRVRVKPRRGYVYVVHVIGPRGLCREPVKPFAVNPARSGPLRGLIKMGIGYGPLGLHKMCLGSYHGTVTLVRAGAPIASGVVVKRFGFGVRRR